MKNKPLRLFNMQAGQWWLLFTVWQHGVVFAQSRLLISPEHWWTRWFNVTLFGWTLRLTQLKPSVPRSKWIELDQVILRASRYRLQVWTDLAALSGFGFGGLYQLWSTNDEIDFELGAGD